MPKCQNSLDSAIALPNQVFSDFFLGSALQLRMTGTPAEPSIALEIVTIASASACPDEDELRRIIRTSQSIKKLTRTILERIEQRPSLFEAFKEVPASLSRIKNLMAIRKAKIIDPKHDFREVASALIAATGRVFPLAVLRLARLLLVLYASEPS